MNKINQIIIRDGASYSEISRATGIPRQTVAYRMEKHGHYGPIHGTLPPPNAKPLTIGGVEYASIAEASRALEVVYEVLQARLRIYGAGGLNPDGTPKKPRAIPGYIDGVYYPSRAAASRATGIGVHLIPLVMTDTP